MRGSNNHNHQLVSSNGFFISTNPYYRQARRAIKALQHYHGGRYPNLLLMMSLWLAGFEEVPHSSCDRLLKWLLDLKEIHTSVLSVSCAGTPDSDLFNLSVPNRFLFYQIFMSVLNELSKNSKAFILIDHVVTKNESRLILDVKKLLVDCNPSSEVLEAYMAKIDTLNDRKIQSVAPSSSDSDDDLTKNIKQTVSRKRKLSSSDSASSLSIKRAKSLSSIR